MEQPQAQKKNLSWITISDWGEDSTELAALAKSMDVFAKENPPDFVMACGDNFYPSGVRSIQYNPNDMKMFGKKIEDGVLQSKGFLVLDFFLLLFVLS